MCRASRRPPARTESNGIEHRCPSPNRGSEMAKRRRASRAAGRLDRATAPRRHQPGSSRYRWRQSPAAAPDAKWSRPPRPARSPGLRNRRPRKDGFDSAGSLASAARAAGKGHSRSVDFGGNARGATKLAEIAAKPSETSMAAEACARETRQSGARFRNEIARLSGVLFTAVSFQPGHGTGSRRSRSPSAASPMVPVTTSTVAWLWRRRDAACGHAPPRRRSRSKS